MCLCSHGIRREVVGGPRGGDVNDRLDEMIERRCMSSMGTKRDLSKRLRGLQKGRRLFYQRHLAQVTITCMHRHTMDLGHRLVCQVNYDMPTASAFLFRHRCFPMQLLMQLMIYRTNRCLPNMLPFPCH